MINLENLLKKNFYRKTIEKGENYYIDGRVLNIDILEEKENLIYIESTVQGSYEEYYFQNISIYPKKEIVDSHCSCPVRENCKHVVAVLFAYLDLRKNKYSSNNEEWFKKVITNINFIKAIKNQTQKETLIFKISLGKNFNNILIPQKAVLNEDKSIQKTKTLSLGNLINHPDREYISKFDMDIIKLFQDIYNWGNINKNHIIYKVILEKLVSAQKLYFEENIYPIKSIKSKDLHIKWEEKSNRYKPYLNINKDYLIFSYNIYEYNPKENILYEIQTPINEYLLKLLLESPKLDKDKVAKLYFLLKEAGYEIEKPSFIEEITIKDNPIPVLIIEYGKINEYVDIEFKIKYDKYYLSYSDKEEKTVIYQNVKKITIFRDLKQEESYNKRLENTNLRNISSIFGYIKQKRFRKYSFNLNSPDIENFYNFINEDIKKLKDEGWEIKYTQELPKIEDTKIQAEIKEEDSWWFNISPKIKFGDKEVNLLPILKEILEKYDVKKLPETIFIKYEEDKFLRIKRNEVKPIINTIINLYKGDEKEELSFSKAELHLIDDSLINSLTIKEIKRKLDSFKKIKKILQPKGVKAKLRNYQIEGISWINFLYEYGFNGILADDMGLGKTIQVLAFLQHLKENKKLDRPSLIIVPTTLLSNWEKEIQKFTPDLKYKTIYGKNRKDLIKNLNETDIILTTYSLIQKDYELYKDKQFLYLILDESQKVKNPQTKTYKAIKELKAKHKLALSGTPIENNLTELWAIFNILMPNFLGTYKEFVKKYKNPIEKKNDKQIKKLLSKKIKPFILRRTKKQVLKELPPKTEMIKYTKFSDKQAKLYETVRVALNKEIREILKKQGIEKSHIHILDALLKLRQICCHPKLLKINKESKVKESAKLELLMDLLEDLIEEDRKILIFSQFVEMLNIIEEKIKEKKYKYVKLTGQTRNREKVINEFKENPDVKLFLISLKAGGVGLNLTEADTVIIYDPWWNPFVEEQAIDRTYRIGQDKPVFVYKLIVENSIEEKILQLQEKKKELQEIYQEKAAVFKISKEEILSLLE